MIERSLKFDAIHGIEHTSRADFVGILVEPPALLQHIRALAASELTDVKRARWRRMHARNSRYCGNRTVARTALGIDNGCMDETKPHMVSRRLILQLPKLLILRAT
jgi:hypothetical protein